MKSLLKRLNKSVSSIKFKEARQFEWQKAIQSYPQLKPTWKNLDLLKLVQVL